MATPERDTTYRDDATTNRTVYSQRSNATGWFVGIVVALALLAIGFLVFNANTGPTTVDTTVTTPAPATDTMVTEPAPATDTTTNEMSVAPATDEPAADATAPAAADDPAVTPVEEAPAPVVGQ